ncbi:hypothetical protein LJV55_004409 [Salmonella enterica]|nr:hypothetical protein [Salmonella enterica]
MEFEQCTIDLSDWIKQEEAESGENAFIHPNTLYFKVLREINEHVSEFVANSGDLVKLAEKYSSTFNQLNQQDHEFVTFRLDEDIFTVSYGEE